MTEDAPDHDNARHHEKMAKKKAARAKIMAGKTIEKRIETAHRMPSNIPAGSTTFKNLVNEI